MPSSVTLGVTPVSSAWALLEMVSAARSVNASFFMVSPLSDWSEWVRVRRMRTNLAKARAPRNAGHGKETLHRTQGGGGACAGLAEEGLRSERD